MAASKLIIFLLVLSSFSCNTGNKKIIAEWDDGKPKIERVYSATSNTFIERNYYDNGQLASETKFVDSLKNGESIAYYKDGKLLGKCSYRKGRINGEVIEFHNTGTLMFKGKQIDGNLVGTATHYYDNGKPKSELYYTEKKVFTVNYWDSSNTKQVANGNGIKKFRDFLSKDKSGNDTMINVFVVGIYKDSLRNGLWKYYNLIDNSLILERIFADDKIVSETWK